MAGVIFSEGSGLNDPLFGKIQEPVKGIILKNVEAYEQTSLIDKIYNVEKQNSFAAAYTSETSAGDFVDVGENGATPRTSVQAGYTKTINFHTWKQGIEVTKEMMEDVNHSKIKQRAGILSQSYGRTRENFGAALLAGATKANVNFRGKIYDTTSADGKAFFAKDHPSITGGKAQSNLFKAALSESVFDSMQEKMQDFKDDDGNLLNVVPNTIIIPNVATLKRELFKIIGSELDPNTANNGINFQFGLWNVLVWNYLPKTLDGKPYFIMADMDFNKNYYGAMWADRVKLNVKSHVDDNTDANIWSGRARFGAGFVNWRAMSICGDGFSGGTVLS